jgi:hypothetical protein
MAIKTLQLSLRPQASATDYTTGWYLDPATGQYYYYDAAANKWYIYTAGYLYPLSVPKQTAPKVVNISAGDTLRIQYSYKYTGPAITVTEWASLGHTTLGLIYTEAVENSKSRSLPVCEVATTFSGSIDLVMPTPAEIKWNDIECKVMWAGGELGVNYQNALNVVGVEAEISEFSIVDYQRI